MNAETTRASVTHSAIFFQRREQEHARLKFRRLLSRTHPSVDDVLLFLLFFPFHSNCVTLCFDDSRFPRARDNQCSLVIECAVVAAATVIAQRPLSSLTFVRREIETLVVRDPSRKSNRAFRGLYIVDLTFFQRFRALSLASPDRIDFERSSRGSTQTKTSTRLYRSSS